MTKQQKQYELELQVFGYTYKGLGTISESAAWVRGRNEVRVMPSGSWYVLGTEHRGADVDSLRAWLVAQPYVIVSGPGDGPRGILEALAAVEGAR